MSYFEEPPVMSDVISDITSGCTIECHFGCTCIWKVQAPSEELELDGGNVVLDNGICWTSIQLNKTIKLHSQSVNVCKQ